MTNNQKHQPVFVTENKEVTISVKSDDENFTIEFSGEGRLELKNTPNNQKLLYILLRQFKTVSGKHLFTFQNISEAFGLKSRQDSNNFYREYKSAGEDILNYLKRKKKLEEAFPLIRKEVLNIPILKLTDHYRMFIEKYPQYHMSYTTYHKYYSEIDTAEFRQSIDKYISEGKCSIDKEQLLQEVLSEESVSSEKVKQIRKVLPESEKQKEIKCKEAETEVNFLQNVPAYGQYILVMFLVACGLNYEVLSLLLGVSKGTVHNMFHNLSFMGRLIRESIKWYSGEVCVDEKWVKINKKWHYVLSVVDNQTGFLLYYWLVSDLTSATWKLFFQRFYKLYGKPKLIISDGSQALASGRNCVFPDVPYQLCKFHKLKNLTKRIYDNTGKDYKNRKRCLRLAGRIFSNRSYTGRKGAAMKLMSIAPGGISCYVENSILKYWSHLTGCYTSNAVERWNRKIEKVLLGRYGLKSEEFVIQLLNALWLKEAIRDKRHFENSFLNKVNLQEICQENIKLCSIIDFVVDKLRIKAA